jgi:serine/threonine-protein kinase
MSPEEFQLGATIDERTTVFNLGRTAAVFLSDGTLERAPFRGVDAQHAVVVAACSPEPRDRYPSVAAFVSDWTAAGE